MKYLISILLCLLVKAAFAQENYVIQLGNKSYNVSLDSTYQLLVDGKKINFALKQKDTLTFKDSSFSFSYLKGYQYSKTNINNAADQYAIITAAGNGYMIQKYSTMNPSMLNELMLQEVTKESLGYGFAMKRENYQRKLKSGQTINVTKAVLTYKDDVNTYEVASLGGKDEGLLVVVIDSGLKEGEEGRKLIKLMWETLSYDKQ